MPWLLAALAVAGVALLRTRRATAQGGKLCVPPLPGPQPQPPAGWGRYQGSVSSTASTAARQALALPLGSWITFRDSSGAELGVLLQYHCHEPDEGVKPVGWHKGATLFQRV